MNKTLLIAFVVTISFCNELSAENIMENFQNKLKETTNKSENSCSIVIAKGKEFFQADSKEVDNETQFYIGSVSKHMTAYMLLVSLQEKYPDEALDILLDKKLDSLFPNSNLLQSIDKGWLFEISLLDLLTHRSGLSDYLDNYNNGSISPEAINIPISSVDLLRSISFNSKKDFLYSNSNYLLIGKLIEEINKDSFDYIFESKIKIPAGMLSSFAPVIGNHFDLKKLPCCTQLAPDLNEKVFLDMANALGTGNVISTSGDLLKWGSYFFNNTPKDIVSIMLRNYGTDPDDDIINLGFSTQYTARLSKLIGHQGSQDSFNSFFGYAPEKGVLTIILSNNAGDSEELLENFVSWAINPEEEIDSFICES